jgi:pimeloyl-ACP methyl ester carboxylesterase
MREAFVAWMEEAAAVSTEGYVDDWLMECCDDGWGFEPGDVSAPVFCWFGEHDRIVPPLHAQLLAEKLPTCQTYGCPECGHFVPIAHWPEILEQLVASPSVT